MRVARVRRKRPVVGDEDQRAPAALQRILEVGDRVDVEVVRRLVQDQQIRVANQSRRQQDATLGSGGERPRSLASRSSKRSCAVESIRVSISHAVSLRVTPQTSCRYSRTVPRRSTGTSCCRLATRRFGCRTTSPESGAIDALEDLEKTSTCRRRCGPRSPRRSPSSIWRFTAFRSGGPGEGEAHVVQADQHEALTILMARAGRPDASAVLRETARPPLARSGAPVVCLVYCA